MRTRVLPSTSPQGLATVICLAAPAAYSALVLARSEAGRAVTAAKQQMVAWSVDAQTQLIVAGDKPTVTPAMLAVGQGGGEMAGGEGGGEGGGGPGKTFCSQNGGRGGLRTQLSGAACTQWASLSPPMSAIDLNSPML